MESSEENNTFSSFWYTSDKWWCDNHIGTKYLTCYNTTVWTLSSEIFPQCYNVFVDVCLHIYLFACVKNKKIRVMRNPVNGLWHVKPGFPMYVNMLDQLVSITWFLPVVRFVWSCKWAHLQLRRDHKNSRLKIQFQAHRILTNYTRHLL